MEEELALEFFYEETPDLNLNTEQYLTWLTTIITKYEMELSHLNYIFCSDEYLLNINIEHLNHDYYTDIITFDLSEEEGIVEGDLFISVDRVKENAVTNNTTFINELNRVVAHGTLHLLGFKDKTEEESADMRKAEELALSLFQQ